MYRLIREKKVEYVNQFLLNKVIREGAQGCRMEMLRIVTQRSNRLCLQPSKSPENVRQQNFLFFPLI